MAAGVSRSRTTMICEVLRVHGLDTMKLLTTRQPSAARLFSVCSRFSGLDLPGLPRCDSTLYSIYSQPPRSGPALPAKRYSSLFGCRSNHRSHRSTASSTTLSDEAADLLDAFLARRLGGAEEGPTMARDAETA